MFFTFSSLKQCRRLFLSLTFSLQGLFLGDFSSEFFSSVLDISTMTEKIVWAWVFEGRTRLLPGLQGHGAGQRTEHTGVLSGPFSATFLSAEVQTLACDLL